MKAGVGKRVIVESGGFVLKVSAPSDLIKMFLTICFLGEQKRLRLQFFPESASLPFMSPAVRGELTQADRASVLTLTGQRSSPVQQHKQAQTGVSAGQGAFT